MTSLQTLLKEKDIRKAVVIDDAFDDVPQPDEIDEGDWSTFFDDLTEEDHKQFSDLYPKYEEITNVSELRGSSEFISILWKNRKKLSTKAITTLFQDYETGNENEKAQLGNLVQILENVGLTCTTLGRDFSDEADDADLIVIDLFLGLQSSDDVIELAIERVRKLVNGRGQTPPLVILISSSPNLDKKRNAFRDKAGLLSSTFRVVSKPDLAEEGRLELILFRLADHYEDAKRVAGFLYAWNKGLECTRRAFLEKLRRLDLSDLAQIRTLLLDSEGERLGDYLLDVADRVLQHEIESNQETIQAAQELNNIDPSKYPAPHLMGTPDLQDLVHRMMFVHEGRLKVSEENGIPHLRFGDLLRWKKRGEEVYGDDVCLVVTPACDLVRNETGPVMLMSGKLNPSLTRGPILGPFLVFFSPDLGPEPLIPACIGPFPFASFVDSDDCSAIMRFLWEPSPAPFVSCHHVYPKNHDPDHEGRNHLSCVPARSQCPLRRQGEAGDAPASGKSISGQGIRLASALPPD